MRVLLFGCKDPREAVGAQETIDRGLLRANSGNLLFNDGAWHAVSAPGTEVVVSDLAGARPRQVEEEFDRIVLPLANAFRPQFAEQLAALTRLLRRTTLPVTVLGVGAQSSYDFSTEPLAPVADVVRDFVAAALDRGPSVGVRGAFTAEWLRSLGFRDVEVVGCPSMFRHGPSLPEPSGDSPLTADSRIVLAMDRHDEVDAWDLARRAHAVHPRLEYVAQTVADLELLLWGRGRKHPPRSWVPADLDHPLLREDRTRMHLDARTWIDDVRSADFVLGTRIHGNVVGVLAGTPCHVLTHDSRTRELAEHFELPRTPLHELTPTTTVAELRERSDPGAVVRGHGARFARYTAFLDAHGVRHTWAAGGPTTLDERLAGVALPPPVRSLAVVDRAEASARMVDLVRSKEKAARRHERQVARLRARLQGEGGTPDDATEDDA